MKVTYVNILFREQLRPTEGKGKQGCGEKGVQQPPTGGIHLEMEWLIWWGHTISSEGPESPAGVEVAKQMGGQPDCQLSAMVTRPAVYLKFDLVAIFYIRKSLYKFSLEEVSGMSKCIWQSSLEYSFPTFWYWLFVSKIIFFPLVFQCLFMEVPCAAENLIARGQNQYFHISGPPFIQTNKLDVVLAHFQTTFVW